jgi:hypothetical protein
MSAYVSENDLVNTMKNTSSDVDMSSLPIIDGDKRYTVISIGSSSKDATKREFDKFVDYCKTNNIKYILKDIRE